LEIATTIVLAIAAFLTAWSGYQASQWGSIQAISLSQASSKRVLSAQNATVGNQDRLLDVVAFTSWLEAMGTQNKPLADFYRARFRKEFTPAFEAWLAGNPLEDPAAPRTPFELPAYQPAHLVESEELEAEADQLFAKGTNASDVSSAYVRVTVFVAAALFFAAISKSFQIRNLRLITLGLAIILLLFGVVNLIPLPIA
jgi:hypothetical protein